MAYTHGVYISEVETAVVSPAEGYAGLPVVVGTSPKGPVNEPQLITRYEDAVEIFGYSDDWDKYTLCEFMYSQFVLFAQGPAVMITVDTTGKDVKSEIIGGYNATSGKYTGLELVNEVFHRFRAVPGIILAPKYSKLPEVAAVMHAKADSVSEVFRCIALADAPGNVFSEIPTWKDTKNYTDERLIVCWPKVKLGDKVFHLSTQLCGVMNRTDNERGDVPYKSPSNELLQCDSCVNDKGAEVMLTIADANHLNGNGIVTALNWTGGWRVWGNRTCAYPANTDPKDCFIAVRRMFDYVGNTFINTFWQKADGPMTVRMVREVVNSFNLYLNGLAARDMILGGRIEFRESENVLTDLMNGTLRFHVMLTPPVPAETIEGILEYDPEYLSALYEAVRG